MKLLLKLLVSTISVFVAAYVIPGVEVDNLKTALIVAVVLGLLNMFVKPILVILTLPLTIFTLGIFYLIINALMVIITSSMVTGFYVDSLLAAFFFGVLVSITQSFLYAFLKK